MVPYANSRFGIIASKTEAEASGIALVKIYLGQRGATDRFWPAGAVRLGAGAIAFLGHSLATPLFSNRR